MKKRNVRSLVSFGARETYVAGLRLIENFTKVIVKGCYIDIGQPATHEKPLKWHHLRCKTPALHVPGEQTYCTFMFQSSSLFTWSVAVIWPALVNAKGEFWASYLQPHPPPAGLPLQSVRQMHLQLTKRKRKGKRLLSYGLLASSSTAERW